MKDDGTLYDGTPHESELRRLAERLGARAAEQVDVERTADAVLARLRTEPAGRRWMQPAWLRIAAALVLVAGGGLVTRAVLDPAHSSHYVAEDLSGLSTTELQQLLATLEETLDMSAPPSSEPSLDQLTEEQLQTMLRSLEG